MHAARLCTTEELNSDVSYCLAYSSFLFWRTPMFQSDRIFSCSNSDTGLMDWFFYTREGIYGPFSSKKQAIQDLNEYIQHCRNTGDDGGRTNPEQNRLSIMPVESSKVERHFIPLKKKKGIESL